MTAPEERTNRMSAGRVESADIDWSGCESPFVLRRYVRANCSVRKQLLVAVACCRVMAHHLSTDQMAALEIVGRWADGLVDLEQYEDVATVLRQDVLRAGELRREIAGDDPVLRLRESIAAALVSLVGTPSDDGLHRVLQWVESYGVQTRSRAVRHELCAAFREIVPPPFELRARYLGGGQVAPWMLRVGDAAEAIARGIRLDGAFDRLPILADALEDDGCEDRVLLQHLRSDGPHVRGCWAHDLVLGQS